MTQPMSANDNPDSLNSRLHIILAERRADVRSALRLLLEEIVLLTVDAEVNSLRELKIQLKRKCPNLILLDFGLSRYGVMRALVQLRALCPHVRIVIIDGTEETRQESLDAGADDFIIKGCQPDRLIEVLKKTCLKCGVTEIKAPEKSGEISALLSEPVKTPFPSVG